MAFNRVHALALLIFVAVSVFCLRVFFASGGPVAFHDLAPMYRVGQLFRPYDFPWDYMSNLGTPTMANGNMVYNFPLIGLSLILGSVAFAQKLFLVLLMAFCGFGFYLAFGYLLRSRSAGFLAGLVVMLGPFALERWMFGHNTILLALAVLPFGVFCFFKVMREGGRLFLGACGLLTALLIAIDPHTAYQFMLFMLLYAVVDLVVFRLSGFFVRLKFRVVQLLFVFGVALVGAFPIFYQLAMVNLTVYSVRAEEAFVASSAISGSVFPQVYFLAFIVAVILFLWKVRFRFLSMFSERGSFVRSQRVHFLFFGLLGVLSLLVFVLAAEPFTPVYTWLFNNVPGLSMFREVNKWFLLSSLAVAFFVGCAAELLRLSFSGRRYKIMRKVLPIVLIAIVVFASSRQFLSGDMGGTIGTVDLPSDYVALDGWLSSHSGNFRVALFPPAVWATTYNWSSLWFLDPMVALQDKSTVELKSEFDLTASAAFSRWVYTSLYSNRTGDWGRLLGVLGVKYVIVRLDADMPADRLDLTAFSLQNTLACFANQTGFRLVKTIGSYSVYENPYYLPNIYDAAGYSVVVGDRRSLVSLSSLSYDLADYPAAFLDDNLGVFGSLVAGSHDLVFQGDPYWSLVVSSLGEQYIVKPWLNAPISTNPWDKWVNGILEWWMWGGDVNAPTDGFIYTEAANVSLSVPLSVKSSGQYLVLAQVYDEVLPCGSQGIRFTIDGGIGLNVTYVPPRSSEGSYVWMPLGQCVLGSQSVMNISNLGGGAAVSKLAVVPVNAVAAAEQNVSSLLESSSAEETYLFDDYSWNYTPSALLTDDNDSNGHVLDLSSPGITTSFHVFHAGEFSLRLNLKGFSDDAVVSVWLNDQVTNVSLTGSDLQIDVGSFNLAVGNYTLSVGVVSGDAKLDLAALSSSFDAFNYSSAAYVDVPVPNNTMLSGSEYQVSGASGNLVFLEGGSGYWQLANPDGVASQPVTVFNYASLFPLSGTGGHYNLTYAGLVYLGESLLLTGVALSLLFAALFLLSSKRFFLKEPSE